MGMAANYGMTKVKFLKSWQGYNPGDLAGFTQSVAQRLVKEGNAAFDKVEKPAQTVTKEYTPKPSLSHTPKKKYGKKKTKVKPKPTVPEPTQTLPPGTYSKDELLAAIDNQTPIDIDDKQKE